MFKCALAILVSKCAHICCSRVDVATIVTQTKIVGDFVASTIFDTNAFVVCEIKFTYLLIYHKCIEYLAYADCLLFFSSKI